MEKNKTCNRPWRYSLAMFGLSIAGYMYVTYGTFFYNAARCCLLDTANDFVANCCISFLTAAHNSDTHNFLCASVISHF